MEHSSQISDFDNDQKVMLAIVDEISKSMTGAQNTRHWAANAVWFDIPPFASKGIKPAVKVTAKRGMEGHP